MRSHIKTNLIVMLSALLLAACADINTDVTVNVIPYPQSVEMTNSVFDKANIGNISYVSAAGMPAEAYELQIRKNKIVIKSSDAAGRFYAEQTLSQLAEAEVMYCGTIKDEPRYEWRGFMLDESRHFHGMDQVKELLDMMARYKLNRFHWHLSDDQAWRVEIKAYPELCIIGAIGSESDPAAPARFYTQDEIREIVAYAAERNIEVMPEIDMPGHATAFTKTFPQFNAGHRTVNPANEELYTVLDTIIKELADLFPGRYIHVGGDEVSTRGWQECPEMEAFMKEHNIASYDDIQKYFEQRYTDIVVNHGKKAIAWDDVINGDLNKENTILQWWRYDHPESLVKCLEMGYKTIICPYDPFYMDYIQDIRCKEGHLVWESYVNSLEDIYTYELKEDPSVIGVQGNLWSERVITKDRIHYMIFPRLIAIAERGWTKQENLDYTKFLERLYNEYNYLDSINVYYYDIRDFGNHPEPMR